MIVSRDGFTTVTKFPTNTWTLDGTINPHKSLCLDSLLKLHNININTCPDEKWIKSMSLLTSGSMTTIPWSQSMPSVQYKLFIKKLIKSVIGIMDSLSEDYYRNAWAPGGALLSLLKTARVDPVVYREVSLSLDRDSGAFDTFKPGPGGFLQPIIYDRFATRTGRLTVASGPNILTLKKEHRKLLKSTFIEGTVCSLDFSALEARIILAEAGRSSSSNDLYAQLSNDLFSGQISRDSVKAAVISELYGSSKYGLGLRLGISGVNLDTFVNKVREYFDTAKFRHRLKEEFTLTGKIKNKYGRLLELPDSQDHLLINTYAQSTGVDVSLLGFKAVMDRLGTDGVRPLFVLHDALILDVRNDRLPDVESVSSVAVPGYDTEFPLKFEKV